MWRRLLCSWQGAVSPDDDSEQDKPSEKKRKSSAATASKAKGGSAAREAAQSTSADGSASYAVTLEQPVSGAARESSAREGASSSTAIRPASASRAASRSGLGDGAAMPEERRVPPLEEALVLLAEFRAQRALWEKTRPARGEPLALVARRVAAKNGGWGKGDDDF